MTGSSPPRPTFPPATPFDPSTPFTSVTTGYDTFVSYKSQDVGTVRLVVEQLIAAGYTPWFAEYIILLRDRDKFQEAIDQGIAESRSGVAFTNDRYAASEYTRLELRQLLDSPACGLEQLIEVRMPPEPDIVRRFPELRLPHPSCDTPSDPNAVLRFLRSQPQFGRVADAIPTQDLRSQHYYDPNLGYSLDLGEWWIEELGGVQMPFVGHVGPTIMANLGGRKARGRLLIGPVPLLRRDQTAPDHDQRAYYDRITEFAGFYTRTVGRQCAGVHMLHDGPLTQFAVTYWADTAWVRKYAIDRPDPRTGTAMEFSFTFAFFGPFREYCRYVCLFDALVASLTWPPEDPRKKSAPGR